MIAPAVGIVMAVPLAAVGPPAAAPPVAPVLRTGVAHATQDKPQSKLWYAGGAWWAWLPDAAGGGRIWQRTGPGRWRPRRHLDDFLRALPGRADVWAGDGRVVAALSDGDRLAIAALRWDAPRGRYEPAGTPHRWRAGSAVETITLDRDATGSFWVAYPVRVGRQRRVVVRRLPRSLRWPPGAEIPLAEGLGPDEICGLVSFAGAVGVMWSDQKRQTVFFRRHPPAGPDFAWRPAETVASGALTADDHINFCVPPAGSGIGLLAVTKTSLDTNGKPIFALRVLPDGGRWRSVDFGTLTPRRDLTRPIVVWVSGRPVCVYTCRSPYRRAGRGRPAPYSVIEVRRFDAACTGPVGPPEVLLRAGRFLNNVTGPKAAPRSGPCIVLASDGEGGVYEGIVR